MRRVALTAVLAVALAGCGGATATAATPTFTNPKGTLTVKVGQKFNVVLDATAGTGYSWQVTPKPDPTVAAYLSSRTTSGDRPGAKGRQTLTFKAKDPGSTAMTLSYVGPGRDRPVAKRLPLKVKVT